MTESVYYFSPSLKKAANGIIKGLERSNIVVLIGDAGSGKTALCKYMIEKKLFGEISSNVKYFSKDGQEFDDTYENCLLIIDFLDGIKPDDNCAIRKIVELSKSNKILLVSRTIDISVLPSYNLVSLPKPTDSEILWMISQLAKQDGVELSKVQMDQIRMLSNGSFQNAKLISRLMQEDTLAKIFEDMRAISDIEFDFQTWSTLSILIGKNFENQGDLLRAKEYYCHAYDYLPSNYEKLKFELLSNLANISIKLGAYMDAISYYKQALNYAKEVREIVFIYNNIGSVLQDAAFFEEAEAYFHKALGLLKDFPSYDKSIIQLRVSILTNLGACYRRMQNYEQALQVYERALSFENNDINSLVAVYHNIATTYAAIGKYDYALSFYRKVLEMIKGKEDIITYDLNKLKPEIKKNMDFCMKNISE